jgi:hypothetical protein
MDKWTEWTEVLFLFLSLNFLDRDTSKKYIYLSKIPYVHLFKIVSLLTAACIILSITVHYTLAWVT